MQDLETAKFPGKEQQTVSLSQLVTNPGLKFEHEGI